MWFLKKIVLQIKLFVLGVIFILWPTFPISIFIQLIFSAIITLLILCLLPRFIHPYIVSIQVIPILFKFQHCISRSADNLPAESINLTIQIFSFEHIAIFANDPHESIWFIINVLAHKDAAIHVLNPLCCDRVHFKCHEAIFKYF